MKIDWLSLTIISCTAMLPATFLWAPILVMQLSQQLELSSTQFGFIFSIELMCSSLATIPAYFWLKHKKWPQLALMIMGIYISSNLLSAWVLDKNFIIFLISRAISALSAGSMLILCTRSVANLQNRDRTFGALIFVQLIVGTIGVAFLPLTFAHFGANICFFVQALVMICCLPLCRNFIHKNDQHLIQEAPKDIPRKSKLGITGVISIFFLYICLGGIWTFIHALDTPNNIGQDRMTTLLISSSILGILGAGSAILLGHGRYRNKVLLCGFSALLCSLIFMAFSYNALLALSMALIFKFTWTLIVPFMLAVISLHDKHGQLINSTNLVLGIGLATGPLVCGYLLDEYGYQVMFLFGAITALISMICIVLSNQGLKVKEVI